MYIGQSEKYQLQKQRQKDISFEQANTSPTCQPTHDGVIRCTNLQKEIFFDYFHNKQTVQNYKQQEYQYPITQTSQELIKQIPKYTQLRQLLQTISKNNLDGESLEQLVNQIQPSDKNQFVNYLKQYKCQSAQNLLCRIINPDEHKALIKNIIKAMGKLLTDYSQKITVNNEVITANDMQIAKHSLKEEIASFTGYSIQQIENIINSNQEQEQLDYTACIQQYQALIKTLKNNNVLLSYAIEYTKIIEGILLTSDYMRKPIVLINSKEHVTNYMLEIHQLYVFFQNKQYAISEDNFQQYNSDLQKCNEYYEWIMKAFQAIHINNKGEWQF